MSPEFQHEVGADHIGVIIRTFAEVLDLPYATARSTTFRRGQMRRSRGKGKEPDHSFYFANEPSIRGKRALDLENDPPPDLWIEVDNRGSSQGRFPVYAEFGVPELWRYRPRKQRLTFFRLNDAHTTYAEIERSVNLPSLTAALVLFALDHAQNTSELEWCRWLRDWAAQLPRP
jgi:Uma2 family endonuclease